MTSKTDSDAPDVPTDAPTDAPTDTPTDAPTDTSADAPVRGIDIVIPPLGESNPEAQLYWNVRPGDFVSADQQIAGLSLDKVDIDLTSPATGVVALLPSKDTVTAGQVVARIEPAPPFDPAHLVRHDELLAAIAAAPDDIAARTAYADFLLYVSGPLPPWGAQTVMERGEYINLVLRLAQPSPDDDVTALRARRHALEDTVRYTASTLWRGPGTKESKDGFAFSWSLRIHELVDSYAKVLARSPIRELTLWGLTDVPFERLHAIPRLAHINAVTLSYYRDPVSASVVSGVLTAPAFGAVDTVRFGHKFTSLDELLVAIHALPPNISNLDLHRSTVGGVRCEQYATEILAATTARVVFLQSKLPR